MGTIVERKRKDGSIAHTAQIVIKQKGIIVHREAQTFERKQAAFAWLEKREAELKRPGGLAPRHDPPFGETVERYEEELNGAMGDTKAACLRKVRESKLARLKCSEITSDKIVEFAKSLDVQPQTRSNYLSHISPIFEVAAIAWKYPLSKTEFDNAVKALRLMKLTGKGNQRDRRPSLQELDLLMEFFMGRRSSACPMHKIVPFAIFSTRRQEEITLLRWDDREQDRILVRNMKDPQKKHGNNVRCELLPEAAAIIDTMPRIGDRIFPFNTDAISAGFTRACQFLGIDDLHFHDLRHDGISRLFEMGRTIPQVAAVSGHRSWSSLQRYTHIRQSGDKYANWKWIGAAASP
ncbi:site-specific integrase [Microbacteriaceae bacterium K1510]|nr:site-specific integrase [Microbacteriaceae bacterium K1510]